MENFDKYAEYTLASDWKSIFELNDVKMDSFGTKKELKVLPDFLEPNEVVFALTSGIMKQTKTSNDLDFGPNTWLVVLTSDRFLFLDSAMLTKSVDSQSIRHSQVQAVSASQGFVFGKIMVDLGSRLLTIDNCQKATVAVIADLANKWLNQLENSIKESAMPIITTFDKLETLSKLHAMEALTTEEFETAKLQLISSSQFKSEKEAFLQSL